MTDINTVTISGHLTRDAELKYTGGGTAVCKFAVAVNRSVKDGDGWKDEASFFDCTLFGKYGEAINQYLTKGKPITVQGELRQERWEKDGQHHSRVGIIVERVAIGGGKSGQQAQPAQSSNAPADEIPF